MFKLRELMTTPVYSLRETDTLQNARALMDQKHIRHVPITSGENTFSGLITNRDVLANTISHLAEIDKDTQDEIDAGIPLKEIMRTDVRTLSPDDTVKEAANILHHHKYGCLPVVENGKLVGIVTEADFLQLTVQLLEAMDQAAKE